LRKNATSGGKPILVTRFSSLGDVILTEPALRALRKRFPDSPIHYLTKTLYTDIVTGFETVDRMIPYDRKTGLPGLLRTAFLLRKESYRLVVDLHGSVRSMIVRNAVSADLVTKVRKNTLRRLLLTRLGLGRGGHWPTAVERYLACVPGEHGLSPTTKPVLLIREETRRAAEQLLETAGTAWPGEKSSDRGHLIALAPGARWQTKMWPWQKFAEIGSKLSAEIGCGVAVLGSREDADLCESVVRDIGPGAYNLAGKTTLLEAGAVLAGSSLLVTNDSGLMHLAVSVGTPVLAIFGPTSRHLGFYPDEELSRVVEVELACRPCTTKGNTTCPKGTHDCMARITVETALAEAHHLLENRKAVRT